MKIDSLAFILAVCLGFLSALSACAPELKQNPPAAVPEAGDLINIERLSYWPRCVLRTLFWWQDLEGQFPLEHGIALYRMTYWSEDTRGELVPTSGLLALPSGMNTPLKGLVSWRHDTA